MRKSKTHNRIPTPRSFAAASIVVTGQAGWVNHFWTWFTGLSNKWSWKKWWS